MKENKEELIKIGQEQIDKAVNLFEGKAIDCLNFLTEHFISTFAEDVDIKLNGYKQDLDNLQNKYYQLEEENQQLRKENEELKAQQIQLTVEKLEKLYEWTCQNHYTEDSLDSKINEMINELKGRIEND